MKDPLEEIADEADAVADGQRDVARRARSMQQQRERGQSWTEILDTEDAPGLLDRLRVGSRRIAAATSRLGQLLARGLAAEGRSRRQIADRLGVSHQRISAILRNGDGRGRRSDPAGR